VRNSNTARPAEPQIELVYAPLGRQRIVRIAFTAGMRVGDAIRQSGLLAEFAEIDLAHNAVGVFGAKVSLNHRLAAGDRVEIYRALKRSPQDTRRQRALKAR